MRPRHSQTKRRDRTLLSTGARRFWLQANQSGRSSDRSADSKVADGGIAWQAPDWVRMVGLFSPHARITRLTPEGIDFLDLAALRAMAEELIELGAFTGAFTSFYECENARRTARYGAVMHVASAYETKVSPTAADHLERGVNSLQLICEDGSCVGLTVQVTDWSSTGHEHPERHPGIRVRRWGSA